MANDNLAGADQTFFYGWWIVGASLIAMSMGGATFAISSFGLFVLPLNSEFGWNRIEISSCLSVMLVTTAVMVPIIGFLTDRFKARPVILVSLSGFAVMLFLIPILVRELWHMKLAFLLLGVFGAGTAHVGYLAIISKWFDRHRGLAIGLVASGVGLGYAYVPKLVQFVIDDSGWRAAYQTLGTLILILAIPLILFIVKETPADMNLGIDGQSTSPTPGKSSNKVGLTFKQTIREREFWFLLILIEVFALVIFGLVTHLVPMLSDRGMDSSSSATVASLLGISALIARPLAGILVDRFFAPYVAIVFFTLSAGGVAIFAFGAVNGAAILAAIMIGLSVGAEVDLMAYLVTRYFGMQCFGLVFGILVAMNISGNAIGAVIYGSVYESSGSYIAILIPGFLVSLAMIPLLFMFRPFPNWGATQLQ